MNNVFKESFTGDRVNCYRKGHGSRNNQTRGFIDVSYREQTDEVIVRTMDKNSKTDSASVLSINDVDKFINKLIRAKNMAGK